MEFSFDNRRAWHPNFGGRTRGAYLVAIARGGFTTSLGDVGGVGAADV